MSFFGDLGKRMIEAREKQARRLVYAAMLSHGDEAIRRAGYTREELRKHAGPGGYIL